MGRRQRNRLRRDPTNPRPEGGEPKADSYRTRDRRARANEQETRERRRADDDDRDYVDVRGFTGRAG